MLCLKTSLLGGPLWRMSTSCWLDSTLVMWISPDSTWCLNQWYLTAKCLLCGVTFGNGALASFMHPSLSSNARSTLASSLCSIPNSLTISPRILVFSALSMFYWAGNNMEWMKNMFNTYLHTKREIFRFFFRKSAHFSLKNISLH